MADTSRCEAGDLSIAFKDDGARDAPVVMLLHGWPDDASTWDHVAAALNEAGLRTIVPTLRGFGQTHFLTDSAPRTGNSGMLAIDAVALLDALGVQQFMVAGHDWGSNVAEALAIGWPERVERVAMLSTPPRLGGTPTPPFWHAQLEWYHWFMATERGAQAIRADRRAFTHLHWENWGAPGWFDEATFHRVAASWDNPDWIEVTLHSYRSRWDVVPHDPRSAWLEERVRSTKSLGLPAMYLHGAEDGVNPPLTATGVADKFFGPFSLIELPDAGHFPQREVPFEVAHHLLSFCRP